MSETKPLKKYKYIKYQKDVFDTDEKKQLWIETFAKTKSRKSACDVVGICSATVWRWRKEDPEFDEEYRIAGSEVISVAEDKIFEKMNSDDEKISLSASKFVLKMKGKNEGWYDAKFLDIVNEDRKIDLQIDFVEEKEDKDNNEEEKEE